MSSGKRENDVIMAAMIAGLHVTYKDVRNWLTMKSRSAKNQDESVILGCLDVFADKATPDSVIGREGGYYCPTCGEMLAENKIYRIHYCYQCGQAVDWQNVSDFEWLKKRRQTNNAEP